MHTIKALSIMTGVNPDTIRSWERRYNLLSPERDDIGRRLYSDEDVERLLTIAQLVNKGEQISRIAKIGTVELQEMNRLTDSTSSHTDVAELFNRLVAMIESRDLGQFRNLIGSALAMLPPHEAAEDVMAPILREIGLLWERSDINVGMEHALTAIIKEQILAYLQRLYWLPKGERMTFTTLGGELHEIGVLMAALIAKVEGFDCHYYGPNLPVDDIITQTEDAKARILAISLIMGDITPKPLQQLKEIDEKLDPAIEIWVGIGHNVHLDKEPFSSRVVFFEAYRPYRIRLQRLRGH